MTVTFSVVIPLYNKAAYVADAVRSACEQTVGPLEVIVVNDGSTDGSADSVRALSYQGLRVIDIPNSGVSVARNTGIEAARGTHVAFLDADDWWSPHFLQAIRRLIGELPDCGIYATSSMEVMMGERLPEVMEHTVLSAPATRIDNYFKERTRRAVMNMSSIVIPRHFFETYSIRFAPGEAHGEDHDVWFQLVERAPVGHVDLTLSAYRRGVSDSLTQVFAWDRLEPGYDRLWQRTCSSEYPRMMRRAARHLVHRRQTSFARNRLVRADDRAGAIRLLLLENHQPATSLFWWSTLVACLMPARARRRLLAPNRGWKDHPWIGRLLGRSIAATSTGSATHR